MSNEQKENNNMYETGNITVSGSVISSVVRTAVMDVAGVHSIVGDNAHKLKGIISGKSKHPGIKVTMKNKENLFIEIAVVLNYGMNVVEVAKSIQEKTKESVESLVGIHVEDVDILVDEILVENA